MILCSLTMVWGSSGCYRTTVAAQRTVPEGPPKQARQWFTLGGLVRLSDAATADCGGAGLAYAESQMSGTDIAINAGLAVAGSVVGAMACDPDVGAAGYAGCMQGFSTAIPFLFSTRTVRYVCAAEPAGPVGLDMPIVPGGDSEAAPSSQATRPADKETE